jgi:hypothetical protein
MSAILGALLGKPLVSSSQAGALYIAAGLKRYAAVGAKNSEVIDDLEANAIVRCI